MGEDIQKQINVFEKHRDDGMFAIQILKSVTEDGHSRVLADKMFNEF